MGRDWNISMGRIFGVRLAFNFRVIFLFRTGVLETPQESGRIRNRKEPTQKVLCIFNQKSLDEHYSMLNVY